MSEMSLREQIERLEDMKVKLDEFCHMMSATMEDMQGQIKYLRGEGFSIEKEEDYQIRYYTPAKDNVDEVIHDIQTRHFEYLDEVIEYLKRALEC
jgi:hypothetical protein